LRASHKSSVRSPEWTTSRVPDGDAREFDGSRRVLSLSLLGWWCFGSQRGGRVYDLASLMTGGLWGRELRGEAFRAARELVGAAVG
jgi:hypothetical protein